MLAEFHGIFQVYSKWGASVPMPDGKLVIEKFLLVAPTDKGTIPETTKPWHGYVVCFRVPPQEEVQFKQGEVIEVWGTIDGINHPEREMNRFIYDLRAVRYRVIGPAEIRLDAPEHIRTIGTCRKGYQHD